jgi:hypothetical protein
MYKLPVLKKMKEIFLSVKYTFLKKEPNIDSLLFFIGTPRSGHSLVGRLLDSSEEVALVHELDILDIKNRVPFISIEKSILGYYEDIDHEEEIKNIAGGYNLYIENSFQGLVKNIKYLGDKKGAGTTFAYIKNKKTFEQLKNDFKIIFVVRNPLDNIASMAKRNYFFSKGNKKFDEIDKDYMSSKYKQMKIPSEIFNISLNMYLNLISASIEILNRYPENVYLMYYEDLKENPEKELTKIFNWLDINQDKEYIKTISSKVDSSLKSTEDIILWENKEEIIDQLSKIDILSRYFR